MSKELVSLLYYFPFFAILIACLGLFGLATFIAEQRTKEIGIRKVLGSSVSGVVMLLSKDFVKFGGYRLCDCSTCGLVVHAQMAGRLCLQDNYWLGIFLLAGVIALLIAVLTVCFQAIRAAMANPVKSLRTE